MVLLPLHIQALLPATLSVPLTLPPRVLFVPPVPDAIALAGVGTFTFAGQVQAPRVPRGAVVMAEIQAGAVQSAQVAVGSTRAPSATGKSSAPSVEQGAVQAARVEAGSVR